MRVDDVAGNLCGFTSELGAKGLHELVRVPQRRACQYCSPRHRMPCDSGQQGSKACRCHVIGCHATQDVNVEKRVDDVARNICLARPQQRLLTFPLAVLQAGTHYLLRNFPGYLKWRSTLFESEDSSRRTVRYVTRWYNTAIRPCITQELATAI